MLDPKIEHHLNGNVSIFTKLTIVFTGVSARPLTYLCLVGEVSDANGVQIHISKESRHRGDGPCIMQWRLDVAHDGNQFHLLFISVAKSYASARLGNIAFTSTRTCCLFSSGSIFTIG